MVTQHAIADAAALLRGGGIVAFPTETVYGLGADATSPEAVARIYAAKGRPRFNPLIAHVASQAKARIEGVFTPDAFALAEAFWPGPLTLVLARHENGTVCDLARAGLASIGLRVPAHPVALAILQDVRRPIAAPSANRSGRVSPTEAAHVVADFGAMIDRVVDGGRCALGLESTIVACLDNKVCLLRPGALSSADIQAVLRRSLDTMNDPGIKAPGMLASHYAPRALLRLNATSLHQGETGLDFGRRLQHASLDLSPEGDMREAAANLYRFLRDLDSRAPPKIAVAFIPDEGLGVAINDRLARAAAPRPI